MRLKNISHITHPLLRRVNPPSTFRFTPKTIEGLVFCTLKLLAMGSMGSGVDIDMLTVGFLKVNRYVEYLVWQQ